MTNHLKHIATKSRTRRADIELGLILAFIADAINAGGFLAVSQYTSHMTGMLSAVADFIVLNKFYTAFMSFLFLLSFIFGAAISAITINLARSGGLNSEYAIALMLEAFLLIVFGLFFAKYFDSINATIALLCFVMGLQNAIITKTSRAEIRQPM